MKSIVNSSLALVEGLPAHRSLDIAQIYENAGISRTIVPYSMGPWCGWAVTSPLAWPLRTANPPIYPALGQAQEMHSMLAPVMGLIRVKTYMRSWSWEFVTVASHIWHPLLGKCLPGSFANLLTVGKSGAENMKKRRFTRRFRSTLINHF